MTFASPDPGRHNPLDVCAIASQFGHTREYLGTNGQAGSEPLNPELLAERRLPLTRSAPDVCTVRWQTLWVMFCRPCLPLSSKVWLLPFRGGRDASHFNPSPGWESRDPSLHVLVEERNREGNLSIAR